MSTEYTDSNSIIPTGTAVVLILASGFASVLGAWALLNQPLLLPKSLFKNTASNVEYAERMTVAATSTPTLAGRQQEQDVPAVTLSHVAEESIPELELLTQVNSGQRYSQIESNNVELAESQIVTKQQPTSTTMLSSRDNVPLGTPPQQTTDQLTATQVITGGVIAVAEAQSRVEQQREQQHAQLAGSSGFTESGSLMGNSDQVVEDAIKVITPDETRPQVGSDTILSQKIDTQSDIAEQQVDFGPVAKRGTVGDESASTLALARNTAQEPNLLLQNEIFAEEPVETAFERTRREELAQMASYVDELQFEPKVAQLLASSKKPLESVFELLFLYSETRVIVEVGSNEYSAKLSNAQLSQLRADAVVDYLVSRGLDPSRFSISAMGQKELPSGTHKVSINALVAK